MVQKPHDQTDDVIRIEGPQTIAEVERELSEVQSRRPSHLLLPSRPKKWWFGGEASLIQLLITWGRQQDEATLVTHIASLEEAPGQLARLVKRPFGFVAAWMAHDIMCRDQRRSLKVLANKMCEALIDTMWRGPRFRKSDADQLTLWGDEDDDQWQVPHIPNIGNRVFLASVDHHPKWRIPQCYFPTGELRYRDDFTALADAMVKYASSAYGGTPVSPEMKKPVGAIVHELFNNTHDWARTDDKDVPLLRSVRGILAQGHSWNETQVAEVVEDSPSLASYLKHPAFDAGDDRWRFLELSVFDSGIGLARHWLSHNRTHAPDLYELDPMEEYRACRECFLRWNSASLSPHKGLGLHEVMQTLSNLKAMFRVRTGRLSLFRDFVAFPYSDTSATTAHPLMDWCTRSDSLTALVAPVEGVLYTMLIPIPRRRP